MGYLLDSIIVISFISIISSMTYLVNELNIEKHVGGRVYFREMLAEVFNNRHKVARLKYGKLSVLGAVLGVVVLIASFTIKSQLNVEDGFLIEGTYSLFGESNH